ncbi:phage tail tube protein [Paenibacillus chungangensis]|uniref:Phage tail tube protein n=1 Tax=Paenibacillus chungangensis TaxID=696535 RepID=A0ABW3HQH4_9BACL
MTYLNVQDTISGKQAKATAIIDDQMEELFYAKTGEATLEKSKADVPMLGRTTVGKKTMGWSGSGTLTIYYMTSKFRELTLDYIKTGRDFYFDLQVVNEDPASGTGKQTVLLRHCNLDSIVLAKFDATAEDALEEELPFTFEDFDILDSFTPVQ